MSKLKYYDGTNWKTVNGEVTGDTLPIGSIVEYGSLNAPTNWLICDGSTVSRTEYAELFAVIGTSFGTGDGSTTFNLPDFRIRVPAGYKSSDSDFNAIGKTGGSKTDNLSNAYAKVGRATTSLSTISYKAYAGSGVTFDRTLQGGAGIDGTVVNASDNSALGGTISTLQPYLTVAFIIKAKQSSGVIANVSTTYSTSETDTYSCDYINNKITGTELWINTSLAGAFGAQTIPLDLSPYKYIELVYYRYPAATTPMFRVFTKVGDVSQLYYCDYDQSTVRAWNREFEVKSTGIEFKIATINGTTNNSGLVPGKIIGHK